ncbi:MAG: NAD(P)H-dependent oxidoreductase [FCB group bacterium]|jgi:FMN reductase|nr:NAD(P)H-dependent oxidoreductase [FCB group bacterium]
MAYLVISCSLNPRSRSRILARAAHARLLNIGIESTLIDLQDYTLPFCDGFTCYDDPAVQHLTRIIQDADGILVAAPIYNYDVNAAAKNLLELTGSAWTEKVVGFLCAAGGRTSYMSVMAFANSLMLDFRCAILPRFVYATDTAFRGNNITDETINERLDDVVAALLRFARALNPLTQDTPD